ncbi:MAG TPA: sensor histidine kinase [Bacillales bacterium]|nr:sensor histidine kinase [Bacillales bacterium]
MIGERIELPNSIKMMLVLKLITKGLVFVGLWMQTDSLFAKLFIVFFSLFTLVGDGGPLWNWMAFRSIWFGFYSEVLLVLVLSFWFQGWPYLILIEILLGGASFLFTGKARWWTVAGLLFVNFLMVLRSDWNDDMIYWYSVASDMAFSFFIAFTFGVIALLEDRRRKLQVLNHKLEDYAAKVEELAITKERNRMAREIHDTVAHGITGLMMQLQAARKVNQRDPDKADALLARSEEAARSVLQEMRQSVRALAPENLRSLSGHESLKDLIDAFSRSTEMSIAFEVGGKERNLDAERQVVVYRVLQEALTNAKRHGEATKAWVNLNYRETEMTLTVEDNGKGFEVLEEGFGLAGMKNRLYDLHGNLLIKGEPSNGCRVEVTIPYDGGHV